MSRYDDIKIQILHAIYEESFKESSPATFNIGKLNLVLPKSFILGITRAIIDDLRSDHYLNYHTDGEHSISVNGVRFIELELEDPNSRLSKILQETTQNHAAVNTQISIPAADRVVTLNHNSDPYKEAISALDAAVTAFRKDHRLENDWGPEKGALLRSIEAGQELLKESQVRVATVIAIIVYPLRVVRERYEHAIAAGLITAAADQLVPVLARAIHAVLSLIGGDA
jgi:hypothetical protein